MKVVIDATGVSGVVVDGVTWAPVSGAPPVDPPPVPVDPAPPGNVGAIVPAWAGWWDARYPGRGFQQPSGNIAAFLVPMDPFYKSDHVAFTQGQTPGTPPHCKTEYYLSRSPGIITPSDVKNYYVGNFVNNNGIFVYGPNSPNNPGGMYVVDFALGAWYVNVRWTYDSGEGIFSIQWQF